MKNKIIAFALLFLTLVGISKLIYSKKGQFLTKFDPLYFSNLYSHSQFAPNPQDRMLTIQDYDLYAYSGWYYLTTGKLDSVNIEHPPLGKYFIGLSILLTGNQNIIQIPFVLLLLLISFLISKKLLNNSLIALLVPLFLLTEKLLWKQLQNSLLDLPHAVFIILFIYLSLMDYQKKSWRKTLFLGLTLGIVSTIKYPITALILGLSYLLIKLLTKNLKKIKEALLVIILSIFIYLSSYAPLFINQGVTGFINVQIRALKIHLSHLPSYPKFVPLRVMFLNQWPVWWDQNKPIHKVEEWNFTWPILALVLLLSPLFYYFQFQKTKNNKYLLIFLFSWLYFLFLNSRLFFPAYLFILIPYMYLFLFWEIKLIRGML